MNNFIKKVFYFIAFALTTYTLNILSTIKASSIEEEEIFSSIAATRGMTNLGQQYYEQACEFAQKKDKQQALQYYQKAAENQHLESMYALGLFYEKGILVSKSEQEAFGWFLKAAQKGHSKSALEVAERYKNGIGIDKSEKDSFEYYQLASSLGEEDAKKYIMAVRTTSDLIKQRKKSGTIKYYAEKFYLLSTGVRLVCPIVNFGLKYYGYNEYVDKISNFSNYAKISGGVSEAIIGIDNLYNEKDYFELSRIGIGILTATDGYLSLSKLDISKVVNCREKCQECVEKKEKDEFKENEGLKSLVEGYKDSVEDLKSNIVLNKRIKFAKGATETFVGVTSKLKEIIEGKRRPGLDDLFYVGNIICDLYNMRNNVESDIKIALNDEEHFKSEGENIIREFCENKNVFNYFKDSDYLYYCYN